jgi:hypothetical protein
VRERIILLWKTVLRRYSFSPSGATFLVSPKSQKPHTRGKMVGLPSDGKLSGEGLEGSPVAEADARAKAADQLRHRALKLASAAW